jgi:type IV secretion system protein VirD4
MTPDEVRMLDNQYALLFIRGERPVQDFKYDILHHPNVRETTDGGAPAFTHGEDTRSIAAMSFVFDKNVVKKAAGDGSRNYTILNCSQKKSSKKYLIKRRKKNMKNINRKNNTQEAGDSRQGQEGLPLLCCSGPVPCPWLWA